MAVETWVTAELVQGKRVSEMGRRWQRWLRIELWASRVFYKHRQPEKEVETERKGERWSGGRA